MHKNLPRHHSTLSVREQICVIQLNHDTLILIDNIAKIAEIGRISRDFRRSERCLKN